MEFWGLEVKPGTTVKCVPGDGYILHLSQAALGESKKSENALMYVRVGDKKLAIGTLSLEKFPQIQFDLVFDKEFELSHTSKVASVFFSGYKVEQPGEGDEMDFDSEDDEDEEEEHIPVIKENGNAVKEEQKSQGKAGPSASKPVLAVKGVDNSDEDETDESDDEGLSPEEGDDDDSSEEDDSSEDDKESEEDEEEDTPTPKKPEAGKKRAAESALKTPVSDKKAKVTTPAGQKTGGKKGSTHVATPHPAKQAGKTPANDKSKEKSPKSGGSVSCKSCSKTFNSEMAMQAHTKAKHTAK